MTTEAGDEENMWEKMGMRNREEGNSQEAAFDVK
jgi:hypothetical protein